MQSQLRSPAAAHLPTEPPPTGHRCSQQHIRAHSGRANKMSELSLLSQQIAHRWLLIILWSAFVASPSLRVANSSSLIRDAQNNHAAPNVSVRMSTSIVESASYQPAELDDTTSAAAATTNLTDSIQQDQEDSKQNERRDARFFRGQDSLAARNDNSPLRQQSWPSPSPPIISHNIMQPNQNNPLHSLAHSGNSGKILDSTPFVGHRWSVSTSRNLSPAAIKVLSQSPASNNQPSPGHARDKSRPFVEPKPGSGNNQRGLIRRILDGSHQAILDLRCEGRGVGKMLKSAKNMLQDRVASIDEHSGLLMFGSSLLAASIPLAVLYSNVNGGSGGLTQPADNRRASFATSESGPLSFVKYLSLQSRVNSMMGWIERSVEHLPSFPRLHPQECVKRSICEAHNQPNKYGAIGFTLRLLFPVTNSSSTDRMDNMEYKVINKYRHAAGFGLNKRIDSNGTNVSACKEKYEDCLISLLDVARNMMDVFLR